MKHFINTFLIVLLILILGNTQNAKAQDSDIDWSKNAKNNKEVVDKYVYPYNITNKTFVNAGGSYVMQAGLNPIDTRMTLRNSNTYYYQENPILNYYEDKSCYIGTININKRNFVNLAEPTYIYSRTAMNFDSSGIVSEVLGFGVDAYGNENDVDKYAYENSYYFFYLSRKFNIGQWSALTLPVDIPVSQVKQTFGEDAELCELTGINPDDPNQILFTPVKLDNNDDIAIKANGCYLIKVTKEAGYNEDSPYTFNRRNEADPKYEEDPEEVTYQHGYIYQFEGISCPDGISASGTGTTSDGKLSYTYYNYHPTYAPAGSYVMSGGNMYHLTSDWSSLIGTAWYLTETTPTTGSKTFVIDNGSGTTDINSIVTEMPGENTVEGIYNINGQKVASDKSLNDLPKGIYIVNGKKYIVK